MRKAQVCLDSGTFGLFVLGHRNLRFRDGISNTGGLSLKIKFSNYLLMAVLQAVLAVCRGISLKEKLSNYLLVAVLQSMLAVCMGINMTLGKDWY